jgi:hypothetical protein
MFAAPIYVLVLTGLQDQYIGAVQGEPNCLQHHAYFCQTMPIQSAGVSGNGNRIIPRWRTN